MAAIEEHELGNDAHRPHFVGTEVGAVAREDDAAVCARIAVTGDMDGAPRTLEEGVDDGLRVVLAAVQRAHLLRPETARRLGELGGDGFGLGACRGQRWVVGRIDLRLADHEHAVVVSRVLDDGAEVIETKLPQQLAADRPRQLLGAGARFAARVEQLPGNRRGVGVDLEAHAAGAGEEGFHLDRNQQVEEGPADAPVLVLVVRGLQHELAQERSCACRARTSVRARLVSSVYEMQGVSSLFWTCVALMKS